MEEKIYINGSLFTPSEAKISVLDHGFLYGYGLFETMHAYRGQIFLLDRHLARLMRGAAAVGLWDKIAGIDLAGACRDTVKANGLRDARVRLTVTGGEVDAFPWEGKSGPPNIVVRARIFRPFSPERYRRGYRIGIVSVRRCAPSIMYGVKSVDYLPSVLARLESAKMGLDEALLLIESGCVAECGNSNVFFVKDGRLLTPSLGCGILPGITREVVIELAAASGISVAEKEISPASLAGMDEAFLTGSMLEIMPVTAIRDEAGRISQVGDGKPGRITMNLMQAYRERVEREIRNT